MLKSSKLLVSTLLLCPPKDHKVNYIAYRLTVINLQTTDGLVNEPAKWPTADGGV